MPYTDALAHLRQADPVLAGVIHRVGPCAFAPRHDAPHFAELTQAIIYQQLSGKAAATIHGRFQALFPAEAVTPEHLLTLDDDALRAAGVSRPKLAYLRDLARHVVDGRLPLAGVEALDDEALIAALTAVKGVGRWTAQMFLMFRLGRLDVLPELDLGIQKAIMRAYGLPAMPKPREVTSIGEPWRPFATIASWYLWRSLELPPES